MKSSEKLLQIWENFKNPERVKALTFKIKELVQKIGRPLKIMEFCGGHTHVILKYAIDELLKDAVKFVHGPGCPVCVLAVERVDYALSIVENQNVILCTYGDLLRVPGSNGKSLSHLRAEGKEVKPVSSSLEAISLANAHPEKRVVFFGIGFETTTPHTAVLIKEAQKRRLKNLFVISNHVIATRVLEHIMESEEKPDIDAFIGPGHVSVIIGKKPYEKIVKKFGTPLVISGFEPLDILQSVYLIAKQFIEERREVEIQYLRGVSPEGNKKALCLIEEVFEIRDYFPWRGLGEIPESAYRIIKEFEEFDGEKFFPLPPSKKEIFKGCICDKIIKGLAIPPDCKLFKKVCTPQNPVGPCMVSSEGACLAYYKYKKN